MKKRKTDHLSMVPVRMVNEWVYCPRLAYLMWVEGEWADSEDTAHGRYAHRRVDKGGGTIHDKNMNLKDKLVQARSVMMSSEKLGIISKMDVIESDGNKVIPIDFKKGKRPHISKGAYDPERVQVCAQGMILEDNGYQVEKGALWYVESRERVPIEFDEKLRSLTLKSIEGLRQAAIAKKRPEPLENSPKCVRCSLAGICLPDETNLFTKNKQDIRPLNPSHDPALPLYVTTPGARVSKKGNQLIIKIDDKSIEQPIIHISHLSLFGPVSVTTPTIHYLMKNKISIAWFSMGNWFIGRTVSTSSGNISMREAQYKFAFDDQKSFEFSRDLVIAKIRNSRTLLRRNWRKNKDQKLKAETLRKLKNIVQRISRANNFSQLLGYEGEAASVYFANFSNLLIENPKGNSVKFSFSTRNRRPPTDPVNALLSLSYALLTRTFTASIHVVGMDPYKGFYHAERHNKPSLALDLMEPYRSIVADSCVLQVINNQEIKVNDFVFNGTSCALKTNARKVFIKAFERRLEQETTHHVFGYKISMRRLIEVQIRLLTRYLQGEISTYPHYLPR